MNRVELTSICECLYQQKSQRVWCVIKRIEMNEFEKKQMLKLDWDRKLMLENWLKSDEAKNAKSEIVKWADDCLIETKKKIRSFYKKEANEPERRYFDSNSDGYRVCEEIPCKSVEEAEEQHQPLTCYPDQIGRWYELSHKFYERSDGKVYGYFWMAMNW